jgi:hypothetical protein
MFSSQNSSGEDVSGAKVFCLAAIGVAFVELKKEKKQAVILHNANHIKAANHD